MRKRWVILVAALMCAGIAVWVIYRNEQTAHAASEITLYGNVDVRQVEIGFRVSGKLTHLLFEEGDRVKKGDLVAVLDKTPYDSQLQEAIATERAISVKLENAEILLKRREALLGVGGVSQEALDDALAHRNQLAAELVQAQAARQVARNYLSYTEVRAPTSGIILTRVREPGTVVNPSDPVVILSVSSPVWIRAFVGEEDLGRVHYGMPATIYTDIPHGKTYRGTLGFISPVAEFTPKTVETVVLRTSLVYRLRVYADNPDQELLQGMPVTVKLQLPP